MAGSVGGVQRDGSAGAEPRLELGQEVHVPLEHVLVRRR